MSTPHTPLPWRFKPGGGQLNRARVLGPAHPVDGGDYAPLATMANPANAELIVRAVNSHEALVAALTLSRRNVGSMLHAFPLKGDATERKALETWLGELNGALAKANVF